MRGVPGVELASVVGMGARELADELEAAARSGEDARWAARIIQVWPKNWYLGLG